MKVFLISLFCLIALVVTLAYFLYIIKDDN